MLLAGAVAGVLIGILSGGSLSRVVDLRFRWPLVPVVALAVRLAGVLTPLAVSGYAPAVYSVTLAVLLAWVVWHAVRLPGLWIVALGLTMNLAVVLANGARMPVEPSLAAAGPAALTTHGSLGQYVLAGPATRLAWLDDRIPAFGALSAGDLVMTLGLLVTAFEATRRRPQLRRSQPSDSS